ncbi:MAG: hypothetical protein H6712_31095 [Myxococcales bacterium]|nr:hypothetical protein [Myxococcales bacterium]MCB9718338.1 hypothetical protein [Myxococcales bacterium]
MLAASLALAVHLAAAGWASREPAPGDETVTPAPAEPVLRWTGPPECPGEAWMLDAVSRYVGRPLDDEVVRATGRIEREDDGRLRLELRLRGAEGGEELRELRDVDCGVLSDAAALMIAVAIDPEAAIEHVGEAPVGEEVPQPQPEPVAVPVDEAEPVAQPPASRAPEASPRPEPTTLTSTPDEPRSCGPGPRRRRGDAAPRGPACLGLGARLALQWGPLPRLGPGMGGDASLLWPRLRLSAGGTFFFAQPARVDPQGRVGGDVRLGVAHLRACGRLGRGTLELSLCGGGEAGALRGIGVGIEHPLRARLPWVAVLGDGSVAWSPMRRLALRAELGAVVPLLHHRFEIAGLGTVHEPAPAGVRGALAIELRLP